MLLRELLDEEIEDLNDRKAGISDTTVSTASRSNNDHSVLDAIQNRLRLECRDIIVMDNDGSGP